MDSTLFIRLSSDGARRDADKLSGSLQKVERAGDGTTKIVDNLNSKLKGFAAAAGVFAFGAFTKGAIDAGREFQRLNRLLSENDLQFVRDESDRLGLSLSTSANGFAKLSAAAAGTALAGENARDIFRGVNTAVAGLGLSAEQANGALVAIEQIISKGTVSAEELRGQLGERIPGAFQIAARSIGLTTEQLNKQLQLGNVIAEDFLPKFAAELEKTYSGAALTGAREFTAEQNRLSNAFLELQKTASDGFLDNATESIVSLTEAISSDSALQAARSLGSGISSLIDITSGLVSAVSLAVNGLVQLNSVIQPLVSQVPAVAAGLGLMDRALIGFNSSASGTVGILDVLKGALNDSRLVGIALVEGLLTGYERIKGGTRILGEAIKLAFFGAFDLILESYAGLVRTIGEGLNNIPFFDGQADALINFGNQVSNVITPLDNYREAVNLINSETDSSISAIREQTNALANNEIEAKLLAEASKGLAKNIEEVGTQSNDAASNTNSFGGELSKAEKEVQKILKAEEDRLDLIEELNEQISQGADIHGVLQRAVDRLEGSTRNAEKAFDGYGSAAKQLDAILDDFNKSQEEQAALLDKINEKFPETERSTDAYRAALKAAGIETEEVTSVMSESWERFRDASFDALQTFYRDGLDGAKDFGDTLKDLFKDMVANILAQITSLIASNAFKSLIGFITGNPSQGGLFDGIGSVLGLGGGSSPQSSGGIISAISSIFGGGSATGASASGGGASGLLSLGGGIDKAISSLQNLLGLGSGSGASLLSTISSVIPPIAAITTLLSVAETDLGKAFGLVFDVFGGGRSRQELAEDQLAAVNQAIQEGRTERVNLGQVAGVDVGFRGGFDENTTFFDIGASPEIQQRVAELLVANFGFDQARVVEDGILRLEDFSREFSSNNEDFVAEVQASIVEVALEITNLEKTTLSSLGSTLVEVDRLFDATAGNGQTTAERIAQAYSEAFNTTIEAGNQWVAASGISADRIAEIFDNSSDLITQNLFGVTASGQDALALLGDSAEFQVGRISDSFSGLNGALNEINLGNLNDIRLPNIVFPQAQQSSQSVQNQQQQQSTVDRELAESVSKLSSEIAETNRELRNQNLRPNFGR